MRILLLLFFFSLYAKCVAATALRPEIVELATRAYNWDPTIETELKHFREREPESAWFPFILASMKLWEIGYTLSEAELDESFLAYINEAESKARAQLSATNGRNNTDLLFLKGMIDICQARYHIFKNHWIRSFLNLRSGLKTMNRVLAKDPSYHDANLPKAIAMCYMVNVPRYLAPLKLLFTYDANLEEGLALLDLIKREGSLMRYEAALYRGSIFLEVTDEPNKAREEYSWLENQFPRNLTIRRYVANRDYEAKRDQEAYDRYASIVRDSGDDERFHRLRVILLCRIGNIFFRHDQYDDSLLAYEAAANMCESLGRYDTLTSRSYYWIGMNEARLQNFKKAKRYLLLVDKRKSKTYYELAAKALSQIDEI